MHRFAAPTVLAAAALIGVLAPQAQGQAAPLPGGAEPLVTEGVAVEGPLVNNVALPTLK